MNGIEIRVIEDQNVEEKPIENEEQAIKQYISQNKINQNPFIDENEQIQSYMNHQNKNDYYKFVPKTNDRLSNREVRMVDMTDDFKIQIEIKTDMPLNK